MNATSLKIKLDLAVMVIAKKIGDNEYLVPNDNGRSLVAAAANEWLKYESICRRAAIFGHYPPKSEWLNSCAAVTALVDALYAAHAFGLNGAYRAAQSIEAAHMPTPIANLAIGGFHTPTTCDTTHWDNIRAIVLNFAKESK